ncbi:MAG: hydroxyacid dehydrogenase [Acidobacteriota bacterium]|nr:MAG: hydroxyacid dehydrogenase [Acidobacteriota bacterium]
MRIVVTNASEQERAAFAEGNVANDWRVDLIDGWLGHRSLTGLGDADSDVPLDAEALIVSAEDRLDADVLRLFSRLRMIVTRSNSVDHIDLAACRSREIAVYTVPDFGDITVAEYTLGLILALLRRFRPMIEQCGRGSFTRDPLRGNNLAGKTVGVVGVGRIGKQVVSRLGAFAVRILGHDEKPDESLIDEIPSLRFTDLETVFRNSDILTFHVPLTEQTNHLLNHQTLEWLREGVFVVNTSRGRVIDTSALAEGLGSGRIAGAALDTFEAEELIIVKRLQIGDDLTDAELKLALATYHLLRSDRVILSPHNAYNSHEAMQRVLATTFESIEAFLKGRDTPNRIA